MTSETVLLFVLGVVVFIVGLLISIGLHELGHLAFAKLFGVKVTQYSLGFGKAMWSFRRGETEYGIRPILLGGYISMVGMLPPRPSGKRNMITNTGMYGAVLQDASDPEEQRLAAEAAHPRAFWRLAPWKRMIVMIAGPAANLVIGIVLFGVLLCGFGAATTSIADVSRCVLPTTSSTTCTTSDAVSPASAAGLENGDAVLQVDGRDGVTIDQLTTIFQRNAGKAVHLVVLRDGVRKAITVTPTLATRDVYKADGSVAKNADGTTKTQEVGVVGVSIGQTLVRQSPTAVLPAVWDQTKASASLIVDLPQRLVAVWQAAFGSQARAANSPVSVVGVGRAIGTVASESGLPVVDKVYSILALLASLNIGLFVLNLVPLLPLDGGHVAGAIWDVIKRGWARLTHRQAPKPVDLAKMMPITLTVVVVLMGMSALLIYADIVRPVAIFG